MSDCGAMQKKIVCGIGAPVTVGGACVLRPIDLRPARRLLVEAVVTSSLLQSRFVLAKTIICRRDLCSNSTTALARYAAVRTSTTDQRDALTILHTHTTVGATRCDWFLDKTARNDITARLSDDGKG
ncbi:hypothetical protein MTP99_016401 [Tenebrio molitor]|jgi:hypothetical protein|nr:hypothetical protein MTP99_016401 [Tenebrio molitor]